MNNEQQKERTRDLRALHSLTYFFEGFCRGSEDALKVVSQMREMIEKIAREDVGGLYEDA